MWRMSESTWGLSLRGRCRSTLFQSGCFCLFSWVIPVSVCVYVFPSLLLGVHHDTSADKRKVTIWNLYSKTQIPNTFILLEIQSLPDGLVYSLSGLVSTGSVSEILILLCGPYSGIVYDPFLFVLHKRGYVRWGLPRWVWFRPPFPFPVCTMLQSFSSWAL